MERESLTLPQDHGKSGLRPAGISGGLFQHFQLPDEFGDLALPLVVFRFFFAAHAEVNRRSYRLRLSLGELGDLLLQNLNQFLYVAVWHKRWGRTPPTAAC